MSPSRIHIVQHQYSPTAELMALISTHEITIFFLISRPMLRFVRSPLSRMGHFLLNLLPLKVLKYSESSKRTAVGVSIQMIFKMTL